MFVRIETLYRYSESVRCCVDSLGGEASSLSDSDDNSTQVTHMTSSFKDHNVCGKLSIQQVCFRKKPQNKRSNVQSVHIPHT